MPRVYFAHCQLPPPAAGASWRWKFDGLQFADRVGFTSRTRGWDQLKREPTPGNQLPRTTQPCELGGREVPKSCYCMYRCTYFVVCWSPTLLASVVIEIGERVLANAPCCICGERFHGSSWYSLSRMFLGESRRLPSALKFAISTALHWVSAAAGNFPPPTAASRILQGWRHGQ